MRGNRLGGDILLDCGMSCSRTGSPKPSCGRLSFMPNRVFFCFAPQCGHDSAVVLICAPHSLHLVIAIFHSPVCQPSSIAPNVEVNRRAEGTSELNRRLGAGEKGDWALERCGVAGDYGRGFAGKQARCACSVSRRTSSRPATKQRRRSTRRWSGRSQSEA